MWYRGKMRWLEFCYVGEHYKELDEILQAIEKSHDEYMALHDAEFARSRSRAAKRDPDDGHENKSVIHDAGQTEIFQMGKERGEREKVNVQFAKITRIGQSVAGTITRFGENDNGPFMILGGDGSFAYAREQPGAEWQKFESFAVGLSTNLAEKIFPDKDKGSAFACRYRDNEKTSRGGEKKMFKVLHLDAAELAEIDSKAVDNRAERAKREQATGKFEPVFEDRSSNSSADDDDDI